MKNLSITVPVSPFLSFTFVRHLHTFYHSYWSTWSVDITHLGILNHQPDTGCSLTLVDFNGQHSNMLYELYLFEKSDHMNYVCEGLQKTTKMYFLRELHLLGIVILRSDTSSKKKKDLSIQRTSPFVYLFESTFSLSLENFCFRNTHTHTHHLSCTKSDRNSQLTKKTMRIYCEVFHFIHVFNVKKKNDENQSWCCGEGFEYIFNAFFKELKTFMWLIGRLSICHSKFGGNRNVCVYCMCSNIHGK